MGYAAHEEGTFTDATTSETWDTVQTTSPNTTEGVLNFKIFTNNMAAGDIFEVRLMAKDAAAGTLQQIRHFGRAGKQSFPIEFNAPLTTDWDLQMRQRAGTVRAMKWIIEKAT